MNIETQLHDEIAREFEELKEMEVGSDSSKTAIEGLTKLMAQAVEIDKLNVESAEKEKTRKFEEDLKRKQMEEDKKDRYVKNGIAVASVLVPSVITVWGIVKSIKFEETGTFTTIVGRGLIGKILPKK